jgi:hypothetical protein
MINRYTSATYVVYQIAWWYFPLLDNLHTFTYGCYTKLLRMH